MAPVLGGPYPKYWKSSKDGSSPGAALRGSPCRSASRRWAASRRGFENPSPISGKGYRFYDWFQIEEWKEGFTATLEEFFEWLETGGYKSVEWFSLHPCSKQSEEYEEKKKLLLEADK